MYTNVKNPSKYENSISRNGEKKVNYFEHSINAMQIPLQFDDFYALFFKNSFRLVLQLSVHFYLSEEVYRQIF